MMTPRGVRTHVYTPERVEARYGIRPDQVPDFIGLKGDTSDNIPGVPGIGDKTAGQLISQYGSLEEVIEHADELSPARKKNIIEHADRRAQSKELATMRRDLDSTRPVAARARAPGPLGAEGDLPPVRVQEPRHRVDELDEAVPAAPMLLEKTAVPWSEELSNTLLQGGEVAIAAEETESGRRSGARRRLAAAGAARGRADRPRRQGAARPGEGPRCSSRT